MKKIAVGMLLALMVSGCDSGELEQRNKQLTQQVAELEQNIQRRNEEIRSQKEAINRLNGELNEVKRTVKDQETQINKLRVTEERVRQITDGKEFPFTVLAVGTSNNKNEKVIYVKGLANLEEKETFLLKAAVQFAHERETLLTFWDDELFAKQYINGDYDAEETVFGWKGFDSRFGLIDTTRTPAGLMLFLSRDDIDNLEFGHYGIMP